MGDFDLSPDYKKLIEQDEEFGKYFRDAAIALLFINHKDGQRLVQSVHSFYQMGMSIEQVRRFFKENMDWSQSDDED